MGPCPSLPRRRTRLWERVKSAPADEWARASDSKRPAKERGVASTVTKAPRTSERGRREASNHVGPREPSIKDWCEDWVSLYFIGEDLRRFEKAEQETQERLQVAVLDEREVDQEERQTDHWRKLGFLEAVQRQHDCGVL